jgi:putative two-component system response regulator
MATILLCDDELMNRKVASKILHKEGFDVIEAEDGKEALEVLQNNTIDLILMDLMMPVMDGYEATKLIKENKKTSTIPLIIISALSDREAINKGLALGANEYISKPFDIFEFRLRVKNAIDMRALQNKQHEEDMILLLAKTAEYRDNETSAHTLRVGEMSAYIADKLGWSSEEVALMKLASPMHDIGKVGIEDAVLLKPGKLDESEFKRMKEHAEIGYNILSEHKSPLLRLAAEIAHTHHEKFNGLGYPRGIKGSEIPQSGAIVAVVDVFDALLSDRPYKKAFSLEKTIDIIKSDSGSHFDPQIVDIFLSNIDEIVAIRKRIDSV